MRSHYRTKHRALILRAVKGQPLSVKLIYLNLKMLFEAGKLKRLPGLKQIYRTVGDLRQCRLIAGNKKGRVTYYKRV